MVFRRHSHEKEGVQLHSMTWVRRWAIEGVGKSMQCTLVQLKYRKLCYAAISYESSLYQAESKTTCVVCFLAKLLSA